MKKFLIFLLAVTVGTTAFATTKTVSQSGTADFTSIQAAIDSFTEAELSDGTPDEVVILDGESYDEQVVIGSLIPDPEGLEPGYLDDVIAAVQNRDPFTLRGDDSENRPKIDPVSGGGIAHGVFTSDSGDNFIATLSYMGKDISVENIEILQSSLINGDQYGLNGQAGNMAFNNVLFAHSGDAMPGEAFINFNNDVDIIAAGFNNSYTFTDCVFDAAFNGERNDSVDTIYFHGNKQEAADEAGISIDDVGVTALFDGCQFLNSDTVMMIRGRAQANDVTIRNCYIAGNNHGLVGSGKGTFVVENSIFHNNMQIAGDIDNDRGALETTGRDGFTPALTVRNSLFVGNLAADFDSMAGIPGFDTRGAAIRIKNDGTDPDITIDQCTFVDNPIAIRFADDAGRPRTATINNCIFQNNNSSVLTAHDSTADYFLSVADGEPVEALVVTGTNNVFDGNGAIVEDNELLPNVSLEGTEAAVTFDNASIDPADPFAGPPYLVASGAPDGVGANLGASAGGAPIGIFDANVDIDNGNLGAEGSTSYDASTDTYTVNGSGDDVWNEADAFQFVYKEWSGDFSLTADVSIDGGDPGQGWIKSMIMARQDLSPGSANITTRVRRDGQFSTQWRPVADGGGASTPGDFRATGQNPARQRFVREGNMFSTYYQDADGSWVQVHEATELVLQDPILIGFGVTAHDTGQMATGTFANVELTGGGGAALPFFEDFEGLSLGPNVDESVAGDAVWTKTGPAGWTTDDSGVPALDDPENGVTEWEGWSFADYAWWVEAAEDQQRSQFANAIGTVAIVDPDEWDDKGDPESFGLMTATLSTPAISLGDAAPGSVMLNFDSSWRDEDSQTAYITVSYDGGAAAEVLLWTSVPDDPNFHDDFPNENVTVALNNPEGASQMVVTFGMRDAGNDWWWAIDNVSIGAGGAGGDAGLIGHWEFEEGSGDTVSDSSGNGNDGTITNTADGGVDDGSVWFDDPIRGAVGSFGGAADDAFVLTAHNLPVMTLEQDFTWAFWANDLSVDAPNNIILGNRMDASPADFVPRQFIKFTPTKFEWHMDGNGNDNMEYDDIVDGKWIHHAVVKTGPVVTYYRNGLPMNSAEITQPLSEPQPLFIAGDNEGSEGENWRGLIDDVRVYDIALSEEDVSQLAGRIGIFDGHIDVSDGNLGADGDSSYDAATDVYTVNGSGNDIWGSADNFQYVYKEIVGDFSIEATVKADAGTSGNDWVKAGLLARQNLDPGAVSAGIVRRPDGLVNTQWRLDADASSSSTDGSLRPTIAEENIQLRLERKGNLFLGYYKAMSDADFTLQQEIEVVMDGPILVGLAVTAHEAGSMSTGVFSDVILKELTTGLGPQWVVGADAGVWKVGGGVLSAFADTGNDPKHAWVNLDMADGNYTVKCDARMITWEDGDLPRAGISVRINPDDNGANPGSDRGLNLLFHDDTNSVDILNDLVSWGARTDIAWEVGTWYTMALTADGANLDAFFTEQGNDVFAAPLASWSDDRNELRSPGFPGLAASTFMGLTVEFDNFEVIVDGAVVFSDDFDTFVVEVVDWAIY